MAVNSRLCLTAWLLAIGVSVGASRGSTKSAPGFRRAGWYFNAGELEGGSGLDMIDERPDAFTNAYLCCDIWSVQDDGAVKARMDQAALLSISTSLHNRSIPVMAVFAVSNVSLLSGRAASEATLDSLVTGAKDAEIDGLLCDYEPTSDCE